MAHFVQLDPVLDATAELERCARFLDLEDWIVMRLRQCEQEITLSTIVPSERQSAQPLAMLWVRHCTARGAAAVALRISPDGSLATERLRAMRATWINAVTGLEFGGGAATILLNSRELSEPSLRIAIRQAGDSLAEIVGNALVYPEDVNPIEMQWLREALHSSQPRQSVGVADDSIAFGLSEFIRCAGAKLRDLRVAIQGFDSTCKALFRRLQRSGARIVAVADGSGGLRDPLGLDLAALIEHERNTGMLLGYPGAEAIVNSEVLESDCDALVLASGPHQVGAQNASRIRARVIVEAVPQAISVESKTELNAAGKIIVPDLLCGGLAPLYYCTEADRVRLASSPEPILRRRVRRTWSEVRQAATRWQLPLHIAAEMLAIERVAEAIRIRGS